MDIKTIKKLSLKDVFGNEDDGFTPWLASNLNRLSAAVNIPMVLGGKEVKLANLRPDIIAYTNVDGEEIIIENQYDKSDSYHIGKLLSYAAYEKTAKYAILVTENAQVEHIEAMKALNEAKVCGCSFLLVNANCYQIDNSLPAIDFEVKVGQDIDIADLTDKQTKLQKFWYQFAEEALKRIGNPFYRKKISKKNKDNWYSGYIGISNIHFQAKVTKNNATIQLLFDSNDEKLNTERFITLEDNRTEIDKAFGEGILLWSNEEEKKQCKIEYAINDYGGYENEEGWNLLIDKMLNAAQRLDNAVKPYYERLKS